MKTTKINNVKVKPIIGGAVDITKIRGTQLFPSLYPNIFLLGKKRSGKTSVIFKILKSCAGKKTIVHIICATVFKDDTYEAIEEMLKKKGCEVNKYTSIDEKLSDIITDLQAEDKQTEPEKKKERKPVMVFGDESDEEEKKEPKDRKISPEQIFILDDLSHTLRSPVVAELMKKNRHFKSMVICSSQNLNDLLPESILQLQYCLMFPHIPREKLVEAHKKLDLSTPLNKFLELYYYATKEQYNFLYVDAMDKFRQNFNLELRIE